MSACLKQITPDDETAEEVALEALMWLAQKLDLMERFLKMTGISGDDIRGMIGRRSFYANLLGFITYHEPTLMDFCFDKSLPPQWVEMCRLHFSGTPEVHWI